MKHRGAHCPQLASFKPTQCLGAAGTSGKAAGLALSAPQPHLGLDAPLQSVQAPGGLHCKEPCMPSPGESLAEVGISKQWVLLTKPPACRHFTHSHPRNHPNLQMRKLRRSQAEGSPKITHLVNGGAVTWAPSGALFMKPKHTDSLRWSPALCAQDPLGYLFIALSAWP